MYSSEVFSKLKQFTTASLVLLTALSIFVQFSPTKVYAQTAETFTVTNTNTSGVGSLPWAITQANTNPGLDNILFSLPIGSAQNFRVALDMQGADLPVITDSIFIEGLFYVSGLPYRVDIYNSKLSTTAINEISLWQLGFVDTMVSIDTQILNFGANIFKATTVINSSGVTLSDYANLYLNILNASSGQILNNQFINGRGLIIDSSNNLNIQSNFFVDTYIGVSFFSTEITSNNNLVRNNFFNSTSRGISLNFGSDNQFTNNYFDSVNFPIILSQSGDIVMERNLFSQNAFFNINWEISTAGFVNTLMVPPANVVITPVQSLIPNTTTAFKELIISGKTRPGSTIEISAVFNNPSEDGKINVYPFLTVVEGSLQDTDISTDGVLHNFSFKIPSPLDGNAFANSGQIKLLVSDPQNNSSVYSPAYQYKHEIIGTQSPLLDLDTATGWTSQFQYPRGIADLNNDNQLDLYGFGNQGTWISQNNGDGTFKPTQNQYAGFDFLGGYFNQDFTPRYIVDLNNDNFKDILGFKTDKIEYTLNNKNTTPLNFGTFATEITAQKSGTTTPFTDFTIANGWTDMIKYPRFVQDINADNYPDIVGFGKDGVWVSLNDTTGKFNPAQKKLADFSTDKGWSDTDKYPRILADVDFDNYPDIVGFGKDGVWVSINNRQGGFNPSQKKLSDFSTDKGWSNSNQYPRTLAKVNNDNFLDIVGFGKDGVWVSLNNQQGGFNPSQKLLNDFATDNGWASQYQYPRFVNDINNDGFADIVGFGQSGVWINYNFGK